MVFSSKIFLFLFLPFVLLVYYGIPRRFVTARNAFLLVMSLAFYAYGETKFTAMLILSILMNWAFGLWVSRCREKGKRAIHVLVLMLIGNLGILAYFKYWMFLLKNVNYFAGSHLPIPQIMLPIGISFFTFQAISYVLDVYRGKGEAQKNPLNVGLYIAFFPQLVAGPIVRYETISQQIFNRKETFDDFSEGVYRFIVGLGKKVLIANNVALAADAAFATPGDELSTGLAWLGAIAYTFQIYFDFSGYSDMAIGLGRMFGFRFLENFNYPYISTSISEFWRRWHISLSSFFRDYVYIPLGGNRVSTPRLLVNLFVVWALTGLWHGADWAFVLWGLLFFVFLVFEKYTGFEKRLTSRWFVPLKYAYTMLVVVVGWVLFKCGFDANMAAMKGEMVNSLPATLHYISTMFHLNGQPLWSDTATLWLHETRYFYVFALIFSFPIVPWLIRKGDALKHPAAQWAYTLSFFLVFIGVFILSVAYIVKSGYNPFIYFNF